MRFLLRWLLLAVSVFLAGRLSHALGLEFNVWAESASQWIRLLIGVAILSFLNNTVGVILKLLTLPLNCLTFGLFSLVINAAVLYSAGQLDIGFHVGNFWTAFVGSILISAINGMLSGIVLKDKDED